MDRTAGFIIVCIAVFICCAGQHIQASEQPFSEPQEKEKIAFSRTSPFLTVQEEESLEAQGNTIPITHLEVTAIFYAAEAEKSRAIIDGRVVSIGDTIDNKKIVTINPEEIILRDSQGYYIVRMKRISPAMRS